MSLDAHPMDSLQTELDLEPTILDTEVMAEGRLLTAGPANTDIGPTPRSELVSAAERLAAVDVLPGFALLGILAMNIVGFAWPWLAYDDPLRGGGFAGSDRVIWFFNHLIFEGKMMTIFSFRSVSVYDSAFES